VVNKATPNLTVKAAATATNATTAAALDGHGHAVRHVEQLRL
jgi:hypothetical protein